MTLYSYNYTRINILQWILTKLGIYLVLKRIWNPIDFQGQRSRSKVKSLGVALVWCLIVMLIWADNSKMNILSYLIVPIWFRMHHVHVENWMKLQNIFLLHCNNYIVQINAFLIWIRELNNDLPTDVLLYYLAMQLNTQMFLQVQKCIQNTGRFTLNWLLYDIVFCICSPFHKNSYDKILSQV
jgi:hypothetical protein